MEVSRRVGWGFGVTVLATLAVLAFGTGTAFAQVRLISPAPGASFPSSGGSIRFVAAVPAGTEDTVIQISSSSATKPDGALAHPSKYVYGLADGSPAIYKWVPFFMTPGTYYWQATSFVCTTDGCQSERSFLRRIVLRPQGSAPPPNPGSRSAPAQALDVHDFYGNVLAISVSLFADPASPANQAYAPPRGDKLVAIEEHLTGRGPGTVSNDADVATSLVGSNDQVYTPAVNQVQGCTNFDYGEFTVSSGESETGCVVFELPDSVSVARVVFTLVKSFVVV